MQLRIHGLDCVEEVSLIKRELTPLLGSDDRLAFDLLHGKLTVDLRDSEVTEGDILAGIQRTGLKAEPWTAASDRKATLDARPRWNRRGLAATISGCATAIGMLQHWLGPGLTTSAMLSYGVGAIVGLLLVLPKAMRALVSLRPDMNLLMTIAVGGAIAIGEWQEASTVAFLFSVSLVLESWSIGRARRAIGKLMDLSPPLARVRDTHGHIHEMAPEDVTVGSLVVIRPGEKIPLDGVVSDGTSQVNQAYITGESIPVAKGVGDDVFAGAINGDGLLEITTTKSAEDTTLAQIIQLVGDASSKRGPSEQWVERFAAVYTPIVMALAALIAIAPPLVMNGLWSEWLYRSLVLLVIACPCALVISTPVSIVAALATAARNGVLVKGGVYMESPARLQAIAFDKTGTLTVGEPEVVVVQPNEPHDESEVLSRAAALEANSNHPLALAIVAAARTRHLTIPAMTNMESMPGKGVQAMMDGKMYWIGSERLLSERGHASEPRVGLEGVTVVAIGNEQHVCGYIGLADTMRESAQLTLSALRAAGIQSLVMLTGDNRATAKRIAREIGVEEVQWELLPSDKVRAIEDLVAKHGQVAMVGDGVNDAPALARASLGIAMGAAGSDVAIEAADIALMSDDLSKLPWLIGHSRRTLNIIRQNIAFSLAIKVLFVVLTFVGFASLWAAIAADMGASLLVIANGLRLLGGESPASTNTQDQRAESDPSPS